LISTFLFHSLGLKRALNCVPLPVKSLKCWIPGECALGIVFPLWKRVKTIYADCDKSPWDRSGKVRVDSSGSVRERKRARERSEIKQVSSSSHPLPWAPNPTCVSKRREQTPKINHWSQTQSITSSSPTKKITRGKKKKKKKGESVCVCVCVQCVVRPGVCMCRALLKCLRFMLDIPHGVTSPRAGWAQGSATRQQAWTAQSLIRTTPCTRGGSGHGQCLGILL